MTEPLAPIPDSYWVEPRRLLAGEYPGARFDDEALERLARFADAGITSYVDLTEEDERLSPYRQLLARGVRYRRMRIPDWHASPESDVQLALVRDWPEHDRR